MPLSMSVRTWVLDLSGRVSQFFALTAEERVYFGEISHFADEKMLPTAASPPSGVSLKLSETIKFLTITAHDNAAGQNYSNIRKFFVCSHSCRHRRHCIDVVSICCKKRLDPLAEYGIWFERWLELTQLLVRWQATDQLPYVSIIIIIINTIISVSWSS